jgi:CRP-like cAMP-binding protein
MTDCTLLVIDRREFVPFLKQNAEAGLRLIAMLCARLRGTTEQLEDLMFLDLPSRLAKKLLSLAVDGARTPGGLALRHPLSQRQIGNLTGFSRESVNKQLMAWQKDGLIRIDDGAVLILDEERLQEAAEISR